jgi:hypothetical protein
MCTTITKNITLAVLEINTENISLTFFLMSSGLPLLAGNQPPIHYIQTTVDTENTSSRQSVDI